MVRYNVKAKDLPSPKTPHNPTRSILRRLRISNRGAGSIAADRNGLRARFRGWQTLRFENACRRMAEKGRRALKRKAQGQGIPEPMVHKTPASTFENIQEIDLCESPTSLKHTRQVNKILTTKDPRMNVRGRVPGWLTQPYSAKDHVHIFPTEAAIATSEHQNGRPKQIESCKVAYSWLVADSSVFRDLLSRKRSGDAALADDEEQIVYDPALNNGHRTRTRIFDTAVYFEGLMQSEYGQRLENYDLISGLKKHALWAGLVTFITWAKTREIVVGKVAGDEEAACMIGHYLGADSKYFEDLGC